jgi:hypothetical protein
MHRNTHRAALAAKRFTSAEIRSGREVKLLGAGARLAENDDEVVTADWPMPQGEGLETAFAPLEASTPACFVAAEPSIAGNPLYYTGIQNFTLVNSQYVSHAQVFRSAEEAAAAVEAWNRLGHRFAVQVHPWAGVTS